MFISPMYSHDIVGQDLIVALSQKLGPIQEGNTQAQIDGNIYFSFPGAVREYLRNRLNIRK